MAADASPEQVTSPDHGILVSVAPPSGQVIGAVEKGRDRDNSTIKKEEAANAGLEHSTSHECGLLASEGPPEDQSDRKGKGVRR